MIEAFLMSTGIVALAEMGDKTQLLSLVLAARYRKPVPIILGILVATLLNHAVAGAVGAWLMHWFGPSVMRWVLGVSFLAMAIWIWCFCLGQKAGLFGCATTGYPAL